MALSTLSILHIGIGLQRVLRTGPHTEMKVGWSVEYNYIRLRIYAKATTLKAFTGVR